MAAILTRNRRVPDDEMPEVLSDDDLLAWGQSLVDADVEDWTPDPTAGSDADAEAVAEDTSVEEPVAEESTGEECTAEDAVAEESAAEDPVAEDPVAEAPVAEEVVAQEVVVEEPVAERAEAAPAGVAPEEIAPEGIAAGAADDSAEASSQEGHLERPEAAVEVPQAVEQTSVEPVEVEPPARPARISQRRRELVALRRHLAAQAAQRQASPAAAQGAQPGQRAQPLTGYRPEASPPVAITQRGSAARTRLQERLAAATPVAPARDGQWEAGELGAPTIRVRLTEAD